MNFSQPVWQRNIKACAINVKHVGQRLLSSLWRLPAGHWRVSSRSIWHNTLPGAWTSRFLLLGLTAPLSRRRRRLPGRWWFFGGNRVTFIIESIRIVVVHGALWRLDHFLLFSKAGLYPTACTDTVMVDVDFRFFGSRWINFAAMIGWNRGLPERASVSASVATKRINSSAYLARLLRILSHCIWSKSVLRAVLQISVWLAAQTVSEMFKQYKWLLARKLTAVCGYNRASSVTAPSWNSTTDLSLRCFLSAITARHRELVQPG